MVCHRHDSNLLPFINRCDTRSEEPADFLTLVEISFLTMLAKLESPDLLKPDSEVKNLGAMMSLAIGNAYELANMAWSSRTLTRRF
jgi:hypothetical protein